MTDTVTGYYRASDIFFAWHTALPNKDDASNLKALVTFEALVHPDHPLRKPGQNGIELFQGVFAAGEARLLFSSAQVEYLRYWLHAMGLTASPISIPSSESLIRKSELKSCAPNIYDNATSLKKAMKNIEKINRRLRGLGGDQLQQLRRLDFERVRSFWSTATGTWLAIDFEAWEREHRFLLEFGWSMIRWDANADEIAETGHLIIKERKQFYNHQYVKGNRDNYNFGESEEVTRHEFKSRINGLISEARKKGPVFLVFHDSSQDIPYMQTDAVKAPLEGLTYYLPDAMPSEGLFVVDTAELFGALQGGSSKDKVGLEQVCRQLRVPDVKYLHNAGNDAHYTMLALKSMSGGKALDEQRKTRWPINTSGDGLSTRLPDDGEEEDNDGPNVHNLVPDDRDDATNDDHKGAAEMEGPVDL